MIGRTLNGTYRLAELVGHGGFADVYLGRDLRTNAVVAVKLLHAHLARDPDVVRRFRTEARAAQALDDPRVARVLDSASDGETPYIVIEYVAGHTLARLLQERGALPVAEAVRIARDVLLALAAAHRAGIVHRDVKPRNVMVTPDGRAKVLDFGIARFVAEATSSPGGVALGTAPYVSPEQARGERVDHRSDLYSFAVLLFEMLVGRPPFSAEHPWQVLRLHAEAEPPSVADLRPDVPAGLAALVRRGLEKSPERRFGSAVDMIAALDVWDTATSRHRPAGAAGGPTAEERAAAPGLDEGDESTVGTPDVPALALVGGTTLPAPVIGRVTPRTTWTSLWTKPVRLALGGIAAIALLLGVVLASAEAVRARDAATAAAAEATYVAGLRTTATAEARETEVRATAAAQESTATALAVIAASQATAAARLEATATSVSALAAAAETNATAVALARVTATAEAQAVATARSVETATAIVVETAKAREAVRTPTPAGHGDRTDLQHYSYPPFEVPNGEKRVVTLPLPLRAGTEIVGSVRSYDADSGLPRVTMFSVRAVDESPEEIRIGGFTGREARLNGGPVSFTVRTSRDGLYELRFRNDGWIMHSWIALEIWYPTE